MKLFLLIFTLLISNFSLAQKTAPEFEGIDVNGNVVKLSDLTNRLVYLDFWASWCKPCKESFPFMVELHNKYSDVGFTIVAVNVDSDQKNMKSFLNEFEDDISFVILFDEGNKIIESYGVDVLPTSFFIINGKIFSTHKGFKKSDTNKIEAEINELLEKITD